MLSLSKHLARAAGVNTSTMRARCFGKLSMTFFFIERIFRGSILRLRVNLFDRLVGLVSLA
jgi:hypothetical protein